MPFDASFARDGADLVMTDSSGQTLTITGFFTLPVAPDLVASNGAILKGALAARMAGSSLEAQVAQSGAVEGVQPIGQVETLEGGATVTRVDGSIIPLTVETKIFQNDLISTSADGKVSVVFTDGTIFTLAEASRMVIDEYVYSADGADNKGGFNLITGGFVFIAGQVAKTGDMEVGTPTATMGIRGTTVQVEIGLIDGVSKVTVALNQDPDGTTGRIDLFDLNGEFIATITATDTKWIISPIEGETRELERTDEDFQSDSILIADALAAYESVVRRVQSGEEVVNFGDSTSEDADDAPEPENPNPLVDPQQNLEEDDGPSDQGNDGGTGGNTGGPSGPADDDGGPSDTGPEEDIDNIRGDAAPDAQNILVTGVEDDTSTEITGQASAETNDPDTPLTFALDTAPANGTATVNPDGTFEYTPDPDFAGTDTFTYTVSDGDGNSDTGTVTVEIAGVNDAPVGAEIDVAIAEDNAFLGSLQATDADDDPVTFTLTGSPANGTVAVQEDGIFQYTPDDDFEGTDTFTYQVTDPDGETGTGSVTVTITREEDVPEVNFELSVLEGSIPPAEPDPSAALAPRLAANDTQDGESASGSIFLYDPDTGETFSTSATLQGTDAPVGSFTLAPSQAGAGFGEHIIAWHYEIDRETYDALPEGFAAQELYEVVVEDSTGRTDTVTITVDILGINDDPTAVADSGTTAEDTPITVNVLANDSDVDGNTISIVSFTNGTNGSVTDDGNGGLTYTPNADFNGSDTFTYTVGDGLGGTATATATITVTPENDAPVATPDGGTTDEDTHIDIDVLANDSDVEGDGLSLLTVSNGANGSVSIVGGQARYQPNADFTGTDSFTYQVTDGQGGTTTGTVTVTVDPVNDAPVAAQDSATTDEDTAVEIDVLANDSDVDSASLSLQSFGQPANGIVTETNEGTLLYTPDPDFNGVDSFTYVVSDGEDTSTATVSITVSAENDPPVAVADSASTAEDTPVTINVLGNDTDVDGPTLSVSAFTQGANGSVTPGANGQLQYTPNANFNGTDTFQYTVSDGDLTATTSVTVTVTAENDAPVAVDDETTTDEDVSVTINVLSNDSDVDSATLTASPKTQPANGSVTVDGNGAFVYTSAPNFDGTDSFTYTVTDGDKTDTGSVTITVINTNDAPSATDDSATVDEDGAVQIDVLSNDTDPDGDTLSVTSVSPASNGSASVSGGGVSYTPNPNFSGPDSFTYTISDGNGEQSTATVQVDVLPVNDPPVAQNDTGTTDEDVAIDINVLSNDSDGDGDSLRILSAGDAANGSTAIVGSSIRYTPSPDFSGQDSFTYQVTDDNGGTSTATVSITINPKNDAPDAANDTADVDEDSSVSINVLSNDTDVDSPSLTVDGFSQGANGTVTAGNNGQLVYTPDANFNGSDSFTYVVRDDGGLTDVATVSITINPVNDPPSLSNGQMTAMEDGGAQLLNLAPLASDIDPNDNPTSLQYSIVQQPADGSASLNGSILRFDPGNDFQELGAGQTDTVAIKVRATDSGNATDTATITVTVNGKNDDPTFTNGQLHAQEDGGQVQLSLAALGDDPDATDTGSSLDYDIISGPGTGRGAASIIGNTLRYDAVNNFQSLAEGETAQVTLGIRATDSAGATDTGSVTVLVAGKNDDPTLLGTVVNANEDGGAVLVNLAQLGSDIDSNDNGASLNYSIVTGPGASQGSAQIIGNTLRYDPGTDFQELDQGEVASFNITLRATDNAASQGTDTATFTIRVTGESDAPVAVDDAVTTSEDTPVTIQVLNNDSGGGEIILERFGTEVSDSGSTTIRANNGTLSEVAGGIRYTPDDDFFGTDTFTYTISGGDEDSSTATVTITVEPVNDAPVANDDTATTTEDESVTIAILENDEDPVEGDPLMLKNFASTSDNGGTITQVMGASGSYSLQYTPAEGFTGTDTFIYKISDVPSVGLPILDTATVTVTVNPANSAPIGVADTFRVIEGSTNVLLDVLDNDSDPDDDPITITGFDGSGVGSTLMATSGSTALIYNPGPGFTGTETFAYEISDGENTTTGIEFTITIDNTVDVGNDLTSTDTDTPVTIDVLANDSDAEGETLQLLTIGGEPAAGPSPGTTTEGGSVSAGAGFGEITYTPALGFAGVDTFTYTVTDSDAGGGNSGPVTGTVTVVVNQDAAADFPEGIPASLSFNLTPDPGDEDPAPLASVSIELEPISTQATTTGVNVLFAIDGSGSITLAAWNTIVSAIQGAVTGAGGLIEQFDDTGLTLDIGIVPFATDVATMGTNVPSVFRVLQAPDINGDQAVTSTGFTTYMQNLVFENGGTNWTAALNAVDALLDTATVTSTQGPSTPLFNPLDEGGDPTDLNALYFITDGNPFGGGNGWQTLAGNNGTLEIDYNLDINPIAIGPNISQENLKRLDTSIEGVIDGTPNPGDPNDPDNPEFDLPTLNSAADLAGDLGASDLFNPELLSLSVLLVRDGQSLGEVADESIITGEQSGLAFEVALADIDGLSGLMGDNNLFIINAQFDTNPNSDEPGDLLQLSTQGSLNKAASAQVINGTAGNDLLLGSDDGDGLNGLAGDDVILGFAGNDSLDGGADDDALVFNGTSAIVLSGGTGQDSLTLQTASDFLLGALADLNIQGIEQLNLTNGVDTGVVLTAADIFDMSAEANATLEGLLIGGLSALQGTGESIAVLGDTTDQILLQDEIGGSGPETFTFAGTTGPDADGNTYDVYQIEVMGNIAGALGIDSDIDVTVNPLGAFV